MAGSNAFKELADSSDIISSTGRAYKRNLLITCVVVLAVSYLPGLKIDDARFFGMGTIPANAKIVLGCFLFYFGGQYLFFVWRDYRNWMAELSTLTRVFHGLIFRDEIQKLESQVFSTTTGIREHKDFVLKRGTLKPTFVVEEHFISYNAVRPDERENPRNVTAYDMPNETWRNLVVGRRWFFVLNVGLPVLLAGWAAVCLACIRWS